MQLIINLLALIPMLIAAIKAVEEAIPGQGKGKEKLDLVLNIIQATGDQVGGLLPAITKAIAAIVSAFNAAGVFKK